jgi:PAS domain S-box-containing protein
MASRSESRSRADTRPALALVGLTAALVVVFDAVDLGTDRLDATVGHLCVFLGALAAGLLIYPWRNRERAWESARYMAFGMFGLATVNATFVVLDLLHDHPYAPSFLDLIFLPLAACFLVPIWIEFKGHFPAQERTEIALDVGVIVAAATIVTYLFLRPDQATLEEMVSSLVFASIGVIGFTGYAALTAWVPSTAHLWQLLVMASFSAATIAVAEQWVHGTYVGGQPSLDLPFGVGALTLAAVMTILPPRDPNAPPTVPSRRGRSMLTALAIALACISIWIVAALESEGRISSGGALILIAVLAVGIALRILVNQVRLSSATEEARRALQQKDDALQETDRVLGSLTRANDTLRASEERLRLLFQAAVDGVVELEGDVIVRGNDAFCRMVGLPYRSIEGKTWAQLAEMVEGADPSFETLPATGQAVLRREGHAFYVEARISEIRGTPPRRLLLVRDVTAARVADQTIRSLFKFLQDRDEDRTRLLRRTNAAIEAERNRIARDLHDGPVQGVSAASLSLEAVLLMLRAGEMDEGVDILSKVRQELSEEADNLRRLMTGLRPPLLEERGLVPALRETLTRFGTSNGMETSFSPRSLVEVPPDLETLAFRVVQEALSNAGKHSEARQVDVTVEAVAGQLRVEIADDGAGFDASRTREFLERGRVGLASMRERVELANGTFMVHSTPGKGTTVRATLPLEPVPAPRELAAN